MVKIIYYRRDENKRPCGTTVILKNKNGEIALGVSQCSVRDIPCKKIGREIAFGRALKALKTKEDHCKDTKDSIVGGFYNPILSTFEKKLLSKVEEARNKEVK